MQRTVLPLNILFSVLVLLLAARMLADIASYKLGRLGASSGASPIQQQGMPHPQRSTTLQSHAIILEKGLFGPATKGVLTPALKPATTNAAPVTAESDLVLLGTATGSSRTSFILIRRTSSNEERVFRISDKVFDLGVLQSVHKESAELRSENRTITLRTPVAPADPTKAALPGQPAPNPALGVIQSKPGGSGIIDQRALNAALDNIGQAMSDARLLPSVKEGKVEGFKVSEVKPQGVFASVGLKNGDVLMKINEFPIDSPEKAIQSFMTLKGQNRIKLDLIRDNTPTSLSYDIR
jgi:general secretion pathway protein C